MGHGMIPIYDQGTIPTEPFCQTGATLPCSCPKCTGEIRIHPKPRSSLVWDHVQIRKPTNRHERRAAAKISRLAHRGLRK